jgi:hypothetical protein
MTETEKVWLRSGRYVCPVCEKVFYLTNVNEYVYKIHHKYYCSYTCWRAAQAPPKPLKGTKKKKKGGEVK